MANLPLEITHSLTFLSNTLKDFEELSRISNDGIKKIKDIKRNEEWHNGEIRSASTKFRKKLDDNLEDIVFEYNLFQTEMTHILSNKNTEIVIYNLTKYAKFVDMYKKSLKSINKLYEDLERDKNNFETDKDYVTLIALNKISIPLCKMTEINTHINEKLEAITNIKKDD